jgi:hypothetical protein
VGLLGTAEQAHEPGDLCLVVGAVEGPTFVRQPVQQIKSTLTSMRFAALLCCARIRK